jgi:hypothetical protein
MLITTDAVIITIYDHEDCFQEMVEWLTPRTERLTVTADLTGEFLGYRFITTAFIFKLFVQEFDICDLKGESMMPVDPTKK